MSGAPRGPIGRTVLLGDVPTWYDAHGAGRPLVYLHGGFSDGRELDPVLDRYADHFRVHRPDRRGHGRTPDVEGPLTYDALAGDTAAFVETALAREPDEPVDLIGYSDGATTALHLALARPDLVRRLVLISGQFHRDGLLPDMFGDDPAAAARAMAASPLARRHAAVSPDGPDHFVVVAEKVVRMALTQPTLDPASLAGVTVRTLVMAGDDDVVAAEHTLALFRHLPDAELAVVPGTSHVLISEKPRLIADLVIDFLTSTPPTTLTPIRRSPAGTWQVRRRD